MKKHTIATMAAVLITAAGTAIAQDSEGADNTPTASNRPRAVEFTPMTRSERLRNYLTTTFGPTSFVKSAAYAGFDQLMDRPTEWKQGAEGYGDRFASVYGKYFVRQTLQYGASMALHEDDRYLASGRTGFWNRTKYAISSAFVARRDNGTRCFAAARMGSAAGSAFISRAWQPASTSDAGHAASAFGITVAGDMGTNVIREFWPDLKRAFRRK